MFRSLQRLTPRSVPHMMAAAFCPRVATVALSSPVCSFRLKADLSTTQNPVPNVDDDDDIPAPPRTAGNPAAATTGAASVSEDEERARAKLPPQLRKDLQAMIDQDRIVVFMTGSPARPRCRFTAMLVELLGQLGGDQQTGRRGLRYSYVDIMQDDEICEGLKVYSGWPTYPQMYIDGQLIGGYDLAKAMVEDGSLIAMLSEKKLL